MKKVITDTSIHNLKPEHDIFLQEVTTGLSAAQKFIPPKYFYDERGSHLFNAICNTPEYYPTRTEIGIMEQYAVQMTEMLDDHCLLIEYGSGAGEKIRLLLDHLELPAGFVPIDISKEHLKDTVEQINRDYPHLEVMGVCADFTQEFLIPSPQSRVNHQVVYFPGSTIGNFSEEESLNLLKGMNRFLNPNDGLLIGIDLKKDGAALEAAYNDADGYTAAFNLNMLQHINNKLGADFDPALFTHKAFYNQNKGRIEMHLISENEQDVHIEDQTFRFIKGETIHTESSYKFTIEEFASRARQAGFHLKKSWSDERDYFGVLYLSLIP